MFHNVLMTTLTPIHDTNEINSWDDRSFVTIWPEGKEEKSKDSSIKKTIKKKKRNRTMFTTEQIRVLEKVFARSKYIDVEKRKEISEFLQIDQKCIKIWFQNRRMKEKKELSESCDTTSESQVSTQESLSPPLKSPDHSNNESNKGYIFPHDHSQIRPEYYYNVPNNYNEEHQNDQNRYEGSNNSTIPEYFNYYNYNFNPNVMRTHNTTQIYPPETDFQYYYNIGEVNNNYITPNIRDWSTNLYDISYF